MVPSQHCDYWCPGAKARYLRFFIVLHQFHTEILQLQDRILENKCTKHVEKIPSRLTHWGRVTHICVSKLSSIGSDNGLSPERRQAIIWTNAGILLIGTSVNFVKKMHLKMSSGKWRSCCLGLNELSEVGAIVWWPFCDTIQEWYSWNVRTA